ncbi:MAG: YihA family ribosome biogenesis GTP-binding protein [Calditrichaeota bacterium]|nr:MAG: YihA family ribosome biogenesis GTP-binding protein [Calditrichota bacterium]
MKIHHSKFIKSVYSKKEFIEDPLPQIAFSGRSNVGKSSLINSIVGMKELAKISSKPGKTRCINYFNIDEKFYLVDLPGYGYARVSGKMQNTWGKLITDYYTESKNLKFVIQLIDSRLTPQKSDVEMFNWLLDNEISVLPVFTKVDKLNQSLRTKNFKIFKKTFGLEEILGTSSKTKEGISDLLYSLEIE